MVKGIHIYLDNKDNKCNTFELPPYNGHQKQHTIQYGHYQNVHIHLDNEDKPLY